jgi:hypothetical protein
MHLFPFPSVQHIHQWHTVESTKQICIHNQVSQFAACGQGMDSMIPPSCIVTVSHSKVIPLKSKLETTRPPWPWPQTLHFKLKLTFACRFPPTASLQQRHHLPHVEQDVSAPPPRETGSRQQVTGLIAVARSRCVCVCVHMCVLG